MMGDYGNRMVRKTQAYTHTQTNMTNIQKQRETRGWMDPVQSHKHKNVQ